MRLRSFRVAVAGAAVITLAGCGGGAGGGDAAPVVSIPTAAPSPSASPTLAAPTATTTSADFPPTIAGGADFASHFIDVANRAFETGDVAELEAISLRTCKQCTRAIQSVRDHYARG